VPWLTLTYRGERDSAPHLAELLTEAGAAAVTFHDGGDTPILEPDPGAAPLWPVTLVEALFEEGDTEALAGLVEALGLPPGVPPPVVGRLADRDWERVGLEGLGPVRFGERLWVWPSWSGPEPGEGVVVRLDPGLAFGTGHHPSTALCLEWLATAPLHGAGVIDYGCGSGILAVAALLLGAERAWAVDHDPQACLAASDNARRNGVSGRIEVCAPEALGLVQAGVVVANILAAPLVDLAPRLTGLLQPGGWLLLSGILSDQAPAVIAAYRPAVELGVDAERDGWCRLAGQRRE
jgi:ribosomal protein L11 methyltransferase